MRNWLSITKQLQEKSFGYEFPLEGMQLDQYMVWNHTAAVKELGEGLDEVPSWKPWVTIHSEGRVNRDAFIGEMVDVLHFIGNMLVAVDCTDEEFSRQYLAKVQKNMERMASGDYDGISSKCTICYRELLDGACLEHGKVGVA